ncbi:thiamine-binding protein [Brachybacterium saurashtrense]|uniref:Thiamine-binding protein n=1 Tax=Brachybacterium saurashtrense TaxID=556288 RepID=A0A345YND6_9MICO|nr:thiamine-binding protein [Brachybacterium saurashtrense]AXK45438.1 thiamine-binding protein [Brachybacterium saurashtrense]RRR21189.1 thiamine-binding protein [Brachybacterium saurashtrense]
MIVAFSVQPTGEPSDPSLARTLEEGADGASVHDAVAAAVRVVRDSGLPARTSAMFTEIEGEWDEVMDVVRRAAEEAGRYGSRLSLVLKADIRPGREGELDGKVQRMEAAVARLDGPRSGGD